MDTICITMHVITRYREQHGVSRAELARQLNCSASFIGHIERGIRRVSWETALEWEDKLGIPREQLCPHIYRAAQGAAQGSL